jgi:hypothetical protein
MDTSVAVDGQMARNIDRRYYQQNFTSVEGAFDHWQLNDRINYWQSFISCHPMFSSSFC